jgi:hypothetical protein
MLHLLFPPSQPGTLTCDLRPFLHEAFKAEGQYNTYLPRSPTFHCHINVMTIYQATAFTTETQLRQSCMSTLETTKWKLQIPPPLPIYHFNASRDSRISLSRYPRQTATIHKIAVLFRRDLSLKRIWTYLPAFEFGRETSGLFSATNRH